MNTTARTAGSLGCYKNFDFPVRHENILPSHPRLINFYPSVHNLMIKTVNLQKLINVEILYNIGGT